MKKELWSFAWIFLLGGIGMYDIYSSIKAENIAGLSGGIGWLLLGIFLSRNAILISTSKKYKINDNNNNEILFTIIAFSSFVCLLANRLL